MSDIAFTGFTTAFDIPCPDCIDDIDFAWRDEEHHIHGFDVDIGEARISVLPPLNANNEALSEIFDSKSQTHRELFEAFEQDITRQREEGGLIVVLDELIIYKAYRRQGFGSLYLEALLHYLKAQTGPDMAVLVLLRAGIIDESLGNTLSPEEHQARMQHIIAFYEANDFDNEHGLMKLLVY